jgi:hypothetical protein
VTVPASVEALTGKPDPGAAQAIARGILAEPYPLAQANASRTLATQALLGVLVPVAFGTVVSGVAVCIETVAANGTLPTGVFVGLYDLTGAQLAVSADVKAVSGWNATGPKSFAFTTAWTVTQDGAVYAAILKNGVWGTEAKVATMTAVTGTGKALGSNAPGAVTQAAQATMPATATLTANDSYPWLALV